MKEANLLNCPFCGGEAEERWEIRQEYISLFWISCSNCGCTQAPSIHRESCIKAWNARKPMERILEHLEDAKAECEFKLKNSIKKEQLAIRAGEMGKISSMKFAIVIVKEEGGIE